MPDEATEHLPFVCYEDDHLLVINKPAGLNTHAPSPYAGEGAYEWLRHREPRWARLAIIHRLDKDTSGLLLFAKTTMANRSLTQQFTSRSVHKKYILVTDGRVEGPSFTATSTLVRAGEKYVSRPLHAGGERAETRFRVLGRKEGQTTVEAEPITGRTHQIRVHAAEHGFPILGDQFYGGTPAARLWLHAGDLSFTHPATGVEMALHAPVDFSTPASLVLRSTLLDPARTNTFRIAHGAADGWPEWYVSRFGPYLLSQAPGPLEARQLEWLHQYLHSHSPTARPALEPCLGAYHQKLTRQPGQGGTRESSPQLVLGEPGPEKFQVRENGLHFEISFAEGYSVGLFLDQRDNRRRFLVNHVAADFPLFEQSSATREVLNTFAYTCGFSVCAAKAGCRTVSIDLSKKYLEWGKRNFALNQLDPSQHEFIYGDVFDWFRRWTKRNRQFDALVLDPPTFSHSRAGGSFTAEKDYGKLVCAGLPLLKSGGVLLASTNATRLKPEQFLALIQAAAHSCHRRIVQQHYVPQPPDFPIMRAEPGYLKTVWVRVG